MFATSFRCLSVTILIVAVVLFYFSSFNFVKTMPGKYKLTYFPLCALGEPIRWLLSYGNLEFEDVRFKNEDWDSIKPSTPFGQVPILEFDGKTYWQSSAIGRFLAKEVNLVGKTSLDALQADIIVDTITDLKHKLSSFYYDEDAASKAAKKDPLQKETIPYFLSRFEKIVKENGGYFVNGQLTWADIYFIAFSDYMQLMSEGVDFFSADYPNLAALKKKIHEIPQIKAWVAKRPANVY